MFIILYSPSPRAPFFSPAGKLQTCDPREPKLRSRHVHPPTVIQHETYVKLFLGMKTFTCPFRWWWTSLAKHLFSQLSIHVRLNDHAKEEQIWIIPSTDHRFFGYTLAMLTAGFAPFESILSKASQIFPTFYRHVVEIVNNINFGCACMRAPASLPPDPPLSLRPFSPGSALCDAWLAKIFFSINRLLKYRRENLEDFGSPFFR